MEFKFHFILVTRFFDAFQLFLSSSLLLTASSTHTKQPVEAILCLWSGTVCGYDGDQDLLNMFLRCQHHHQKLYHWRKKILLGRHTENASAINFCIAWRLAIAGLQSGWELWFGRWDLNTLILRRNRNWGNLKVRRYVTIGYNIH